MKYVFPFKFIINVYTKKFSIIDLLNRVAINFDTQVALSLFSCKYHVVGLFIFRDSLLTFSQVDICANPDFMFISMFPISAPLQNKFVSPANKIGAVCLHTEQRSLMQTRNNSGLNIDPWGTPLYI